MASKSDDMAYLQSGSEAGALGAARAVSENVIEDLYREAL